MDYFISFYLIVVCRRSLLTGSTFNCGLGAHGFLFQKIWATLLVSICPPSPYGNAILGKLNEMVNVFVYVLQNCSANGANLLSYDVGLDEEEEYLDTSDAEKEMYDALLQEQTRKVEPVVTEVLFFFTYS